MKLALQEEREYNINKKYNICLSAEKKKKGELIGFQLKKRINVIALELK
jgi:hypothetical protein